MLWESMKWSPDGKSFDQQTNSLNQFFKEMYGDQSGEFVFGYWGLINIMSCMLPFSLSSVSVWGAVFNLLFTPVAFGIWRLCLRQLTWRWWWRRRWGRGRGGRVGLDSSGLIYLNAVRYLGYLWSFSLMGQSQKADTYLITWLWSCFRLVSNQRTRQSREL